MNIHSKLKIAVDKFNDGDFTLAATLFESILQTDEEDTITMEWLGETYRIIGDLKKSSQLFNKVLKINPHRAFSIEGRGSIRREFNDLQGSAIFFQVCFFFHQTYLQIELQKNEVLWRT